VCKNDDQVDELEHEARRSTEEKIRENPEMAGHLISLLGISRDLERIADHATNIAEDVIYMVDGEIVRHQLSETELDS
jgi:phosphate transport system protein